MTLSAAEQVAVYQGSAILMLIILACTLLFCTR
jgi:hypothetical protein